MQVKLIREPDYQIWERDTNGMVRSDANVLTHSFSQLLPSQAIISPEETPLQRQYNLPSSQSASHTLSVYFTSPSPGPGWSWSFL